MSPARQIAVGWALSQLGAPVLMGYRGDLHFDRAARSLMPTGLDFNVWDCSGLMCGAIKAAGGKDMRGTHNAQMLYDGMRKLVDGELPQPGDGAFYGTAPDRIIHIAIWLPGGKVLSADGATWGITSLPQAKAARCMVRLHETMFFRPDCSFSELRRNTFLDSIDKAEA